MKQVKSLSFEEQKKYSTAIKKGYFDDFDANPRAWRHTFTGAYLWQNPTRTKNIDRFAEMLGHTPTWEDITDINLEEYAIELRRAKTANSCRTTFAEIKAVINRHKFEIEIPSKRFMYILSERAEPSDAIYLTEKEVEQINDYKPRSPNEQYVKKMFMIECYTGARTCDSQRFTIENCDMNSNTLTYTSKKTKTRICVPVHRNLMQYLRDPAQGPMHIDLFNRTLRSICRKAGIHGRRTLYRRGGEVTAEKWELISSHTGRRSFATNLYNRHANPALIAKYMGHSSPDITVKRYIISDGTAPEEVLRFFIGDGTHEIATEYHNDDFMT